MSGHSGPTPRVKVTLDRERHLRFSNRALYRLEEETGQTLTELSDRLQAGSLRAINALVWAGLLHEEPELTLDQTVDRIDLTRLGEIAGAAGKAVQQALGEVADGGPEEATDEGNVEEATAA